MSERNDLTIRTRVAHAGFEEHRFEGRGVFGELAGGTTSTGLWALAIGGRTLSDDDCAMLDDLTACATMADPRIWPLKVARTIASYGHFIPGFAAGYLATDGGVVGPASIPAAMQQLRELVRLTDGAVRDVDAVARALGELRRRIPHLAGFGVPFRPRDERVEAMRARVRARGRALRTHWALLETLLVVLRRSEKKLEPNMASAIAAVALDLGFEPEVGQLLGNMFVAPCFVANTREAAAEPSSALRTLPLDRVHYVGRARRRSAAREGER